MTVVGDGYLYISLYPSLGFCAVTYHPELPKGPVPAHGRLGLQHILGLWALPRGSLQPLLVCTIIWVAVSQDLFAQITFGQCEMLPAQLK